MFEIRVANAYARHAPDMRLFPTFSSAALHLTYCLNVHAGETWAEHLEAIRRYALTVRNRVSPDQPFGLGLRLSAQAAHTLSEPAALESFQSFLADNALYVFTVNAFPYGRFHGPHVKERVYQPDWTTEARREYTLPVADILAALLPPDMEGGISTLPGAYCAHVSDTNAASIMAERMMDCVAHLATIRQETGRVVHLGLEPEPSCVLETADDVVRFFNDTLLRAGRDYLIRKSGISTDTAEERIRTHLGVCLDTCHAALQFEEPAHCMDQYKQEGIRISKIQISAALETNNTEPARAALRSFDEPVYLHQVRARSSDGTVRQWNDLSEALIELPALSGEETVRVHVHVPLMWRGEGLIRSTAPFMDEAFWARIRQGACPHLEIETYTLDVLPDSVRSGPIDRSIAEEFAWVLGKMK